MECPLNAVKDAIILLIGGHFDEIDSLNQETALIGDTIRPLSKVESSISYLASCGYTIQKIKALADEMRKNDQETTAFISTDAVLYYSREVIPERPINILINKRVLYQLSYGVYVVSREGVIKEQIQR